MFSAALVSCGYLLLVSGHCIYRLVQYSDDKFTKVLPEFIIASVGITAFGGRSLHALVYNLFWRSYPLDPRLIAKEWYEDKDDKNIADWILWKTGVASLVYSFYYHHGYVTSGAFIVFTTMAVEALCLKEEIFGADEINPNEPTLTQRLLRRFSAIFHNLPYPVAMFWILSSEFIGRAVGNPYCRLANAPLGVIIWAFPPEGFNKGWSIIDSINDYMMICYIILMTEGLLQTPIVN